MNAARQAIRHGGNAAEVARALGMSECPAVVYDFSVNLNPLGPPPALRQVLLGQEAAAMAYPEEFAASAGRALAATHGLEEGQVVVGNGSTEIFGWILQALRPRRAGRLVPCYGGYQEVCAAHGVPLDPVGRLSATRDFALEKPFRLPSGVDLLFLASPNNPTGRLVPPEILRRQAHANPEGILVVDTSFIDFAGPAGTGPFGTGEMPENALVVKSLTKFFHIAGLRLGMAWGSPGILDRLKRARLPWSVNGPAQALAPRLYADTTYVENSRKRTGEFRRLFEERLRRIDGLTPFPSDANFLLVRLPEAWPAPRLQAELLRRGILIRSCEHFEGLGKEFVRLAVRPPAEQDRLVAELEDLLGGRRAAPRPVAPRKPAIMVVGTSSNAGKSVVAAGLCRLLARRGLSVAPFKAQNMALNSFVTAAGGEMGRAQVVQAHAAGVLPHVDMNPVLLKPLGENGSQVIVNGKPIGNFKARAYYAMKGRMRAAARAAYDRLAARHDILVLEGAGSPAEINLAQEDFVNMDMAAYAGAQTLLVADIDRGGVFASILGTLRLLPPEHRRLFAGVIVNKFRGDASLLAPGIRDIEALTGVPVLGVLPYLPDLRIEEEDSLGLERPRRRRDAALQVAVIRLPRISNFTDFQSMENDEGIALRYVSQADAFGTPDLVILPGTKNTRADLEWLHARGMASRLRVLRERGVPIFGICGGFQMLGGEVVDEAGVEGQPGVTPGLGLLPVRTRLTARKELAQVEGTTTAATPFWDAGIGFRGYEIHAGKTRDTAARAAPLNVTRRGGARVDEPAGAVSGDGRVFGSYIHGLFDAPELRVTLWRALCLRKGLAPEAARVREHGREQEFDRLADVMENHLRLDFLFP